MYGAAGHTGRFVVRELLRRGHAPIAVGRDPAAIAAAFPDAPFETRSASVDAPEQLDRAMLGAVAVINCAGPFLDTAQPLLEAALRTRVNYVDVTAEQGSALSTLEHFDGRARERGVIVVPAAGFFGALADLLATDAVRGWARADRIDIAIALDSWWPTNGTRRTGERNTAPRLAFFDAKLQELQPSAPASWSFPEPVGTLDVVEVPLSETVLIAHHLRVCEIRNSINQAPLRDLHDPATPAPVAADERGRSNQRFTMDVIVRNGVEERRVTAHGRDVYAVTAPIVVAAVEQICTAPRLAAGAFALGQLVDAAEYLQDLVSAGDIAVVRSYSS